MLDIIGIETLQIVGVGVEELLDLLQPGVILILSDQVNFDLNKPFKVDKIFVVLIIVLGIRIVIFLVCLFEILFAHLGCVS